MKKIISALCILLLIISCQTEDVSINKNATIDIEANAAFKNNTFPEQIFLPTGFSPEGIVGGIGSQFYVGSILNGAIYKGDFRTGEGVVLVPPNEGFAIGLDYDSRTDYLYVAAAFGVSNVYNGSTGELIATISLNTLSTPTFVNDCIVTKDAVYYTDSFRDVIYKVPLTGSGLLPEPIVVEEIPLTGDFQFVPYQPPPALIINGNGIVASPNGNKLIVSHSLLGLIYLVDPETGAATGVDLGGAVLENADGLVLQGRTLYVVQNFNNQVSVVELSPDFTQGEVVEVITHPEFKVPATATIFGSRLYSVNARFDVAPPPFFGGGPNEVLFDVIGVPAK